MKNISSHYQSAIASTLIASLSIALFSSIPLPASAQQRDLVAPRVVAHEWGVWKIRAGQVTHLDELAAETPSFVVRSPSCPAVAQPPRPVVRPRPPQLPPPVIPLPQLNPPVVRPQPARKPVVFLYTDRPVNITAQVGFRGGEPWLYYPSATVSGGPGVSKTLTWRGHLVPSGAATMPQAAPGHWWNELRNVGAGLFLGPGGTSERFLFYDGPVLFERPFIVTRRPGGALVSPMTTERTLWLVDGNTYTETNIDRTTRVSTPMGQGDMSQFRARLDRELQSRGLSPAEARSLLETWRDDLFNSPAARAVALVPRNLYDLMLPLHIDPQPDEIVRVGLVIEEL